MWVEFDYYGNHYRIRVEHKKGWKTWIGKVISDFSHTEYKPYAIRIEQISGYYKCSNCNYKYIPTYKSVLFSTHFNRTRKMKCPNCNKKSWHKKVISK